MALAAPPTDFCSAFRAVTPTAVAMMLSTACWNGLSRGHSGPPSPRFLNLDDRACLFCSVSRLLASTIAGNDKGGASNQDDEGDGDDFEDCEGREVGCKSPTWWTEANGSLARGGHVQFNKAERPVIPGKRPVVLYDDNAVGVLDVLRRDIVDEFCRSIEHLQVSLRYRCSAKCTLARRLREHQRDSGPWRPASLQLVFLRPLGGR